MEELKTEYEVTFIADVQDGEEESIWLDGQGLITLCNEETDADVSTVDGALDFLREVGYSIRSEKIPEIDSSGFDVDGFNHYQDKLNR